MLLSETDSTTGVPKVIKLVWDVKKMERVTHLDTGKNWQHSECGGMWSGCMKLWVVQVMDPQTSHHARRYPQISAIYTWGLSSQRKRRRNKKLHILSDCRYLWENDQDAYDNLISKKVEIRARDHPCCQVFSLFWSWVRKHHLFYYTTHGQFVQNHWVD